MKTRILSRVGALFCAISLFSQVTHAETLKEIYLDALQNDHQFKAARWDLSAGKETKNLARAGLLPNISGDATWTKNFPAGENYDPTSKQYFVGLRQNLLNLNAWHTYQRGKSLTEIAQARYATAEQSLIIRTAQAYFDALKAVDNLISAKAEEDALAHQLEQTKQRFEVGLTAITEVHEAQAAFDSATANRLVAEGGLGIAFEALEVLTGHPQEQLAPLQHEFPVKSPEPLDRAVWVEQALSNNAALKTAQFVADAALSASKVAQSDHLPTLTGSVGYSKSENNNFDPTKAVGYQDREGGSISLDLHVPLYRGGSISAARRQSYDQYLAEQQRLFQTQRDVVQQTRSYHLGVITSAATVKARAQAITSARSALEATQAGYEVGTRDLVDVLNAQRTLYLNQRNYFDSLYIYVMQSLQLRQASGILTGDDIENLNQWLDTSRSSEYRRPQ